MNLEGFDIFQFSDYRKFLDTYQINRQTRDPSFNRSRFCRELGLPNTRSYFNDIVKGRRNISSSYVKRFIQVLEMTPDEAQYFRILVYFDQSAYEEEVEELLGPEISLTRWKHTAIFDSLNRRLCLASLKGFLLEKKKA